MKRLTINKIRKLQAQAGLSQMQNLIDTGDVWHLEGTMGRMAMDYLKCGACFLPDEAHRDYWGNTVPSRKMVKEGTTGSLTNSINYWEEYNENE
jgi:hypothetical protein